MAAKKDGPARGPRELVNGTRLAAHLCFERVYLDKLLDAGVIERDADGRFDPDASRRRYIQHLREARKLSPRSAADAELVKVKTEMLQTRLMEKQRDLIPREEAASDMEELIGRRCHGNLNLRRDVWKSQLGLMLPSRLATSGTLRL